MQHDGNDDDSCPSDRADGGVVDVSSSTATTHYLGYGEGEGVASGINKDIREEGI